MGAPSYWLLGEDQLPLAKAPERQALFVAYFKHSLLFNRQLILSDSLVLNNRNFRVSLQGNTDFRELIRSDTFAVAVRGSAEEGVASFAEVREQLRSARHIDPAIYDRDDDLDWLVRHARQVMYELSAIGAMYTANVRALFHGDVAAARLSPRVLALIQDEIELELSRQGNLTRRFFHYASNLGQRVASRDRRIHWRRHQGVVREIATAPYLSALPMFVKARPVYAEQHRNSFEILRGESSTPGRLLDDFTFDSELGLSSFVNGLSRLGVDDIHALRASQAALNYFAALDLLGEDDASMRVAFLAFKDYQLEIDRRILSRWPALRGQSADGAERRLRVMLSTVKSHGATTASVISVLAGLAMPLAGLATAALSLMLSKEIEHRIPGLRGVPDRERLARAEVECAQAWVRHAAARGGDDVVGAAIQTRTRPPVAFIDPAAGEIRPRAETLYFNLGRAG
ncbi:MAG: hypothetical protein H6926_02565 [Chromatiales bacterium]|nr:hypothetical protein [Chromatiales bacterium]